MWITVGAVVLVLISVVIYSLINSFCLKKKSTHDTRLLVDNDKTIQTSQNVQLSGVAHNAGMNKDPTEISVANTIND